MKDTTKILKAINNLLKKEDRKEEIIVLNYFKENLDKLKYKIVKDINSLDERYCFWVNEKEFHITMYKSGGEIVYNFDVMNFSPNYFVDKNNEYEKDKNRIMRIFKIDKLLKENK